jgi:molybdopterin-binding protein
MNLELREVTKKFASRAAVDRASFSVGHGSVCAVLGPNGSGKTTLLRLIDLLVRPDGGEILYDGVAVSGLSSNELVALRRKMAYVQQSPFAFSGTVEWNAGYGLKLRGHAFDPTSVARALESVGLSRLAQSPAKTLSGGELKRLALARAIALKPELLLLDEPGANIDPLSISIIDRAIERTVAAGASVIVVTHQPLAYSAFNPSVVILRDGAVARSGPASSVLSGPETLFEAEFSGFENILEGSLVEGATQCVFRSGDLDISAAVRVEGARQAGIRASDILVSAGPLQSSARNSLKAKVARTDRHGHLVMVSASVKGTILKALLTSASADELAVAPGAEVFVTFKASSVRLFKK